VVERPLRILQVSTFDIHGGAAKVAWNLFAAYRTRGYSSWLAVGAKRSNDPDVLLLPNQDLRGQWYQFWRSASSRLHPPMRSRPAVKLLTRLVNGLAEPARAFDFFRGLEDFHFPGTARLLTLTSQRPHIVHCHNLHGGYFDLRMLPRLSQQVPVILTLHDAWLLSGHCAHSFACERWKTGCGHCPDLTIYPAIQRDATHYNWRRKREIYARSRLYIATPSRWLMKKVEQSMLAPAVVEARVLPNGVDLRIFRPDDKQAARDVLGISQKAKVLLTTGVMIKQNIWKDYSTLRHAIALAAKHLSGQDLLFIVLGEDAPPERIDQVEIRFVPYQEDPRTVARYYQAADVYVHAAREDTFPTSVLEAMACGTPVVATAVGGILEQVEDTRTGFLVPIGDAQALAIRITQFLSDDVIKESMGKQAAKSAQSCFNFDRQVDAYLSWYDELMRARTGMVCTEKPYALSNPA
jgi:glycosyltransferase involved in cell wall biosynthesis